MIVHGHVQTQPVGGFVADRVVEVVVHLVTRVGVLDTVLIGTGAIEDRSRRVGVRAAPVCREPRIERAAVRVQQYRADTGATVWLQNLHAWLRATQFTE